MAFADPQTLGSTTLPRTGFGPSSGTFKSSDGTKSLTISHSYGKRNRHIYRVDVSKIAADPFVAGQNNTVSMSAYVLIDTPKQGYTAAEQVTVVNELLTALTAGTNARFTQFVGGEN